MNYLKYLYDIDQDETFMFFTDNVFFALQYRTQAEKPVIHGFDSMTERDDFMKKASSKTVQIEVIDVYGAIRYYCELHIASAECELWSHLGNTTTDVVRAKTLRFFKINPNVKVKSVSIMVEIGGDVYGVALTDEMTTFATELENIVKI